MPRELKTAVRLLVATTVLCLALSAQSVVVGNTVVYNAQVNSNFATYTNIYVVFPPAYGTNNYSNFVSSVMGNSNIDGVTLQIGWNQIETTAPMPSPCASPGTDTCQQDGTNLNWYHTYDWTGIDPPSANCSSTNPSFIAPWFCKFGSPAVNKTVNFVLTGISPNPTNTATPTYVTGQTWIQAVNSSYGHQDVLNTSNTLDVGTGGCGSYSGPIIVNSSMLFSTGGLSTTVQVTWSGSGTSPQAGDTIWVSGFGAPNSGLNNSNQQWGSPVTTPPTCSGGTFCYTIPTATNATANGGGVSIVRAIDSWPVPYEEAFAAGYLAFLKAAIYHFNHLNHVDNTTGLRETTSQIRYIRPGPAVGGEGQPICKTSNVMMNTMPGYSEGQWIDSTSPIGWYRRINQAVESANPRMQIMYSINVEGTTRDASFATRDAALITSYGNVTGVWNAFGSQGLAQTDITSFNVSNCPDGTGAPDTGNNWGCMFTKYWSGANTDYITTSHDPPVPTNVALELQQIDCSNPCAAGGCSGYPSGNEQCFLGNTAPGKTGDLRTLLPSVTGSHHASIIELYSQDALLAFDPMFCNPGVGTCTSTTGYDTFSGLTPTSQYYFFIEAGYGCGSGNCYANKAIAAAHGPH